MLRFGLCCIFRDAPIRFRQTTAKVLLTLDGDARRARLGALCLENATSLVTALETVHGLGIGAFRAMRWDAAATAASLAASAEEFGQRFGM